MPADTNTTAQRNIQHLIIEYFDDMQNNSTSRNFARFLQNNLENKICPETTRTTHQATSGNNYFIITIITTTNITIKCRAVPDLFFFPIRPDLEWQIQPEPDFQIDCNFTNFMCKTLRTYKWCEFLIIFFLQQLLLHHLYTHSRSNLYHSNVSSTYYVSKKYLGKSTFQIRQNCLAPVEFLPEPDLGKVPDSDRSQSRSRNPVQP